MVTQSGVKMTFISPTSTSTALFIRLISSRCAVVVIMFACRMDMRVEDLTFTEDDIDANPNRIQCLPT